jgi:hypothetical protein
MTTTHMPAIDQTTLRAQAGLQCPECFGVRIAVREDRFGLKPRGWLCEECGCQWSPPIAKGASR